MEFRPRLNAFVCAACVMAPAGMVWAQTPAQAYPARTIRIVVPYAAGGPADAISRTIAQRLSDTWKQSVIVDNKPGASGMIGADIVMALLSGEVTTAFVDYATLKPHLESGKVRALAVSDTKRTQSTPDVPTFTETGYKGFEASSWIGLFTTAKTPPDVVQKLHAEVARVLKQPDVIAKFQDGQGFQMGGQGQGQWTTQVAADFERWGVLIRKAGVKLD